MTENSNPEKRPGDIERRDKLREWLIDALALGMGGFALFYYKPEGFVAGLIVFIGAYTLTSFLPGPELEIARGNLPATCALSHPLTLMCAAWLTLPARSGLLRRRCSSTGARRRRPPTEAALSVEPNGTSDVLFRE